MKTIEHTELENIVGGSGAFDFAKDTGRALGWVYTAVTGYQFLAPATSFAIATATWKATQ